MSDFEIEYLDEDADLVQFCVKGIIPQTTENKPYSLLSERDKSSKLKRKHRREYEDDEDYHPSKNKEVVRKYVSLFVFSILLSLLYLTTPGNKLLVLGYPFHLRFSQ